MSGFSMIKVKKKKKPNYNKIIRARCVRLTINAFVKTEWVKRGKKNKYRKKQIYLIIFIFLFSFDVWVRV